MTVTTPPPTDTRIDEPFTEVDDDDRNFLLAQINARLDLDQPLTAADVIAERSGVRPLVVDTGGADQRDVDWTSLSRKHAIETDRARMAAELGCPSSNSHVHGCIGRLCRIVLVDMMTSAL